MFPESSFLPLAEVPQALDSQVERGSGSGMRTALTLTRSLARSLPTPALADIALLQEEDDYDVMQDPEFLQSVLENLPGVDPNNEAIRNAMGSLASQATKDGKKDKKEEEKK